MPHLLDIHFRPPLAVARLGGSSTPLENYRWTDDPSIHGASHTVIELATTLDVTADGSVLPYMPSVIKFADEEGLRPVAPFFELWATVEYTAQDAAAPGSTVTAGARGEVPLTSALLAQAGGSPGGVLYTVHVANRKAARRTGDDANSFEVELQVRGDDHRRHPLLAATLPKPNREPLVFPDKPIPLGSFQVLRPMPRAHMDANLDVLRVRFTPARGEVYGPPTAVVAKAITNDRVFEIVPPENRILNPKSSWLRYDASYATYMNPEPYDTYDGADQDEDIAWGVVDDTCDGVIQATVIAGARRFNAVARLCAGPPDYAPDRRPFVSLADDLTDRDVEPLPPEALRDQLEVTRAAAADLFERAFETASLTSLDNIRRRGIGDNDVTPAKIGDLPFTDSRSFTPDDKPYADENVQALIQNGGAPTPGNPLPFSALIRVAHAKLAQEDELITFLRARSERAKQMIRPAYGAVAELEADVSSDATPNPNHRDPRIDRDLAHDMRMPPYMRDESARALSLTRKQYVELMRYIDLEAQRAAPRPPQVPSPRALGPEEAAPGTPVDDDSALRQRVRDTIARIRANQSGGSGQ